MTLLYFLHTKFLLKHISLCNSGYSYFLLVVISRECYQCLSTSSFKACDAGRVKVSCLSSQQCIKASAYRTSGVKDEAYVKGCAATCVASTIEICRNPNYKCEVHCCSSDYCNGASGLLISGFFLILTASLIYFFGF